MPASSHYLDSYLRQLPEGIHSYSECMAKASIYRGAIDQLPSPLDASGLPQTLADLILQPVPTSAWIPEVANTAVYMTIADQVFTSENEFLDWVGEIGAKVFQSPMYRILMAVASPKRLASGGKRRWEAFHRGTQFAVETGDNGATTTVGFPEHLFSRLVLEATARSILEAYRASGAREATYDLIDFSPTHAVMRSVWYPEIPG